MQEEVENKTLTLAINSTKFTGRTLKEAISKYMAHRKGKKQLKAQADVHPRGKQSVRQLIGQNQGVSNIELTDPDTRAFERICRKYGVDYAVKKDRSTTPPKFLIFFKGRDADAINAAFTEFTAKRVKTKDKAKASVLEKLTKFMEKVKDAVVHREKKKELER